MKKNKKQIYRCQSCGYQAFKWIGKCPDCNEWDTFVEETVSTKAAHLPKGSNAYTEPVPISSIQISSEDRLMSGLSEFDRVLGGGLVLGSLTLIGGDPGVGKSTLMLQVLDGIAHRGFKVLYISGEESIQQLRLRSDRLATSNSNILVGAEIDLDAITAMVEKIKPDVLVIDSIQTVYNPEIPSVPGSVSQVRESTMRLMVLSKSTNIPVFLVGHVTKEGAIAGPRLLEHIVDTVLYFEGDRNHVFRILRGVKNRFGSTNEIGVFEMKETGLSEVTNPSAVFISERPLSAAGSIVTASMEGSRPILVELQALVSKTNLGTPRRTILGLDQNRVALLTAVIEKKLGMHLMGFDLFMNVAGGVKISEPAIDMGIVAAIASSFLDAPIKEGSVILGEAGLTGEVRAISHVDARIAEVKKMGFKHCLLPDSNLKRITSSVKGIALEGISSVSEAIEKLFHSK